MKGKNLILITHCFPYGISESFLETEIQILSRNFENIYIIPKIKVDLCRVIPSNVTVLKPLSNESTSTISSIVFSLISLVIGLIFGLKKIYDFSYLKKILIDSFTLGQLLNEYKFNNELLVYSYWFDELNLSAAFTKLFVPNIKLVSRAHGFDLYRDRLSTLTRAFRKTQLNKTNMIYCVSDEGRRHLVQSYPQFINKYEVSYLGTKALKLNVTQKPDQFVLITIARLHDIKRPLLYPDTISKIKQNIKWFHFGSGEMEEQFLSKCNFLPDNIEFINYGAQSNSFLIEFLSNHHIDVLINLSKSEGLPVSMMEVLSFGIPIIATDVGGVNEIISNESNGKLIPSSFSHEEFQTALSYTLTNLSRNETARKCNIEDWNRKFNAEKNYQDFCFSIQSLS